MGVRVHNQKIYGSLQPSWQTEYSIWRVSLITRRHKLFRAKNLLCCECQGNLETVLAINDLNNDALLDIVFANLDGAKTILWNAGNLQFTRQELDIPVRTRAVMMVYIEADDWGDIAFTFQRSAPMFWRNQHAYIRRCPTGFE